MRNRRDQALWRLYLRGNPATDDCPDPLTLAGWADCRLAAAELALVDEHLARCSTCLEHVIAIRDLRHASAGLSGAQSSERLAATPWTLGPRLVAATLLLSLSGWGGFWAGSETFRDRRQVDREFVRALTFDLAGTLTPRPEPVFGNLEEERR